MPLSGDAKREYQRNWLARRKAKFMKNFGTCFFCGSDQEIQPHHVDYTQKTTHRIWSLSDEKIETELGKCIALCKSCHDKFHMLAGRRTIEHGTPTLYRYGCRCSACTSAKTEEARQRAS